jgi:hypothetical protein
MVDETIKIFDVETGKNTFSFRTDHGDALTAASLDHRGMAYNISFFFQDFVIFLFAKKKIVFFAVFFSFLL